MNKQRIQKLLDEQYKIIEHERNQVIIELLEALLDDCNPKEIVYD